jgi:hypothetical protein
MKIIKLRDPILPLEHGMRALRLGRGVLAAFTCRAELAQRAADALELEGFAVSRGDPGHLAYLTATGYFLPASFACEVSDGSRRVALRGFKVGAAKTMVLVVNRLGVGWRFHALFGRKKFEETVVASVKRAVGRDPDDGFEGAGVTAPLMPPPHFLTASVAMQIPKGDSPPPFSTGTWSH